MLDTRGQDIRWSVNMGEQEAAIDQICIPIRIFRRQNLDVSKSELRIPASRDGEKVSGTFVARNARCIRHVTHKSRRRTNAAAQIERQFHQARLCALKKTPGGWIKSSR